MSVQFKSTTAQADAILRNDKKPNWEKLTIDSMPKDLQSMAIDWINAELAAKAAKAAMQSALDDKVEQKPGKRLIVTLGRDVGPNTDSVLTAWVDAAKGATRVVDFNQFIKG